jgi:uncharacterized protein YkwD
MGFRLRSFGNTSGTSTTLAPSLRGEADAAASDPGGLPLFKPVKQHFCAFLAVVVTTVLVAPAANAAIKLTSPEAALLNVMNQTRQAHGLAPLRVDPNLVRAARWQSSDMLNKGYFAHGAFGQRMAAFRVRGARVAENLAWGSGSLGTPEVIVREWLNSPHHRRNLLRAGYRRVGIGTVVGTFSGTAGARLVTADFAGR